LIDHQELASGRLNGHFSYLTRPPLATHLLK
jgi:hypothetical protein